jgi:protein DJ-1
VDAFIENSTLARIVQDHKERKAVIGAICAAPVALHEWGLLDTSTVLTSHPSTQPQLSKYAYTLDRVAEDGQLITSRGAGTAFEFSLALIRRLTNDAIALRIAGDIVLYE